MSRLLSVALAAVALAGCFAAHERSDADARVDAGPADAPMSDAARPDAGTIDAAIVDAATIDAGHCALPGIGSPIHACVLTATGTIPAGEAYTLPLGFLLCECPGSRRCDAAVAGDVISLTTTVCDDPVECTECAFDAGCALPPLPVGHYFVDVNGTRTMELDARPRVLPTIATPICAPIPAPPDSALVCDLDLRPAPRRPLSVCRPALEDVGRYVRFDVIVGCPGCFDADAGCETQLEGSRVVLRPHVHRCECPSCGVCDPSCTPLTVACVSPPLPSGVYDVVVEAEDHMHDAGPIEIRDVFEPGDRVCTEIP